MPRFSRTFAAAARRIESKTSGRTVLVSAMAYSVLARPSRKACTFAAAARHSESKTQSRAAARHRVTAGLTTSIVLVLIVLLVLLVLL